MSLNRATLERWRRVLALLWHAWELLRPWRMTVRSGLSSSLRALGVIVRDIRVGGLEYRAMSLVYTSLLALVPLLAVGFYVLKTFGADSDLEPLLLELLTPLGDKADLVAERILDSVKRLKVGVLGGVGFLFLFFTSVDLLEKIEESFNHVWRSRTSRSLLRRVSDYLTFTLIGPFLVFTAFGSVTGVFAKKATRLWMQGWLDPLYQALPQVLHYAFVVSAFMFFYWLIPNTRVKFQAALLGGLVAGSLWKLAGWLFALFMAGSAQYHAVYSSFAILALFMIWLYVSWLIVLVGVQVSFYAQHPAYLRFKPGPFKLSARLLERTGLALLLMIGRRFFRGEPPCGTEAMADALDLPEDCVIEALETLVDRGLVMPLEHARKTYAPARDLSTVTLTEMLTALRLVHEDAFPVRGEILARPELAAVAERLERSRSEALAGLSWRDLVTGTDLHAMMNRRLEPERCEY
jgi:membrane protein